MTKRKFLGANPDLVARLRFTDEEGATKEIVEVINEAKGNITAAARKLGIAKRTLFLWASEYVAIANALKKARRRRIKEREE